LTFHNYQDFEKFTFSELRKYIRRRLKDLYFDPPILRSQDELPEDFIIEAVKRSTKEYFREKFEFVICSMLKIEWKKLKRGRDIDFGYFSRLLFIIETFRFRECREIIFDLASDSQYLIDKPS
jgi:predicted nucleotidyltransferase